jgi:hypothetical protein
MGGVLIANGLERKLKKLMQKISRELKKRERPPRISRRGNRKGKNHQEYLDVDERTILKCILQE